MSALPLIIEGQAAGCNSRCSGASSACRNYAHFGQQESHGLSGEKSVHKYRRLGSRQLMFAAGDRYVRNLTVIANRRLIDIRCSD